jgi:hypothetical protein
VLRRPVEAAGIIGMWLSHPSAINHNRASELSRKWLTADEESYNLSVLISPYRRRKGKLSKRDEENRQHRNLASGCIFVCADLDPSL